jgi:putative DNA primase/helicase
MLRGGGKFIMNDYAFEENWGELHRATEKARANGVAPDKLPHGDAWEPEEDKNDPGTFDPSEFDDERPKSASAAVPVDDASGTKPKDGQHLTDNGNARRLVDRHGQDLRYCHPWKKWVCWDGRRWQEDATAEPERRIKETRDSLYQRAVDKLQELKLDRSLADKDRKQLARQCQKIITHCFGWESASRVTASVQLARSEPGVPILPDDLDRDHWLLNCVNGTLDLKTGQLRPHRREDFISKLCPTAFDPKATCPVFDGFIAGIFQRNADLIRFQQRLLGRCLTGDVSEQILAIFWGVGANGKTTLINALFDTIGDEYTLKAPVELFMENRGERHPTERAALFHKRLVVASETQQGCHLNEALVKELAGGDLITGRRMREDFWTFPPTHKAILLTNHKPAIHGTDDGIWRKLRLVPFETKFWDPDDPKYKGTFLPTELRQDKNLSLKLKAEATGILAWLVRGCLDWQRDGLTTPDKVRTATLDYRQSEDIVAQFLMDRCLLGPDYRCRASEMYAGYKHWAESAGEKKLLTQTTFGGTLTDRGFERYTSNGTWYRGLALRNNSDTPEDAEPWNG